MKAYKIEILIIDHDQLWAEEIKEVIENQKYPNYCISPRIMDIQSSDLGEWDDSHPLNNINKMKDEYMKIFNAQKDR